MDGDYCCLWTCGPQPAEATHAILDRERRRRGHVTTLTPSRSSTPDGAYIARPPISLAHFNTHPPSPFTTSTLVLSYSRFAPLPLQAFDPDGCSLGWPG
ncbi:hypothetical protein RSAG8_05683, partial [Rhizoctonia solani AG-8 WAC10335]